MPDLDHVSGRAQSWTTADPDIRHWVDSIVEPVIDYLDDELVGVSPWLPGDGVLLPIHQPGRSRRAGRVEPG